MANNTVVGNNGGKGKANASFASTGVTVPNTNKITKVGNPFGSYKPERSINAIEAWEDGEFYIVNSKVPSDLSSVLETKLNPSTGSAAFPFIDNFVGSAGPYSGHTADSGSALNPTTGGLLAVNLDGSGHAVFTGGGYAKLIPQGAIPANRKVTIEISTLAAVADGFIIQLLTGGGDYSNIVLSRGAGNTLLHNIQNTAGIANASPTIPLPAFPFTFMAQIVGGTVTSSVNGGTPITAAAAGIGAVVEVVTNNGGALKSMRVEPL